MKRRTALFALGFACIALVIVLGGVSLATPSADRSKASAIELVFRFSDSDTRLDLGNSGFSTGDTETFSGPILDAQEKGRIGFGQGHCVVTLPGKPLAECMVTLALPKGQIATQGPNYFDRPFNQGIIGGTGEFRSARGELRAAPFPGRDGWRLTLKLIR